MACCKCCCENGIPPGECCGNPESCCRQPDYCCGPIGSRECCVAPRVCCGVGAGQKCCQPDELCCGEECCPPGRCCGSGENQVCCNEGQYCCDGVCSDDPCDPCYPCESCFWPADRSETGIACTVPVCCEFPQNLSNSRFQTLSLTLPSGISWKTGYPDALDLCNWRWCTDTVIGVCRFITKTRYKLLALDCSTQSVVDLTDIAATGTFETTSPGACTNGPDFPEYFGDPVPNCPP